MPISNYAPLDEALERRSGYDVELKNGISNHAPVVAEALCAMGRSEAVMPWIARYRDRLLPLRPPGARSHIGSRGSALGKHVRCADWAEFFAQELQRAPWREVLDRWVARLAPGFFLSGDAWGHSRWPRRTQPFGRRDGMSDTRTRRRLCELGGHLSRTSVPR